MKVESRSIEDEIRAGMRKLLIGAAVCALAGVGCLIVGNNADATTINMMHQARYLSDSPTQSPKTVDDLYNQEISTTMRLEAGREYLLLGKSFMMDARVSVSIQSDSGTTVTLDTGSGVGSVRSMSVVGSFTVPETDDYQIVVSSRAIAINCAVVDASIRGYQAATALLPVGLVFLAGAFALLIWWAFRKGQRHEDMQAGAALARSRANGPSQPSALINVLPAQINVLPAEEEPPKPK